MNDKTKNNENQDSIGSNLALVKMSFLNNQFELDELDENFFERLKTKIEPVQKVVSYYRCALMEVETKFKVLNENFLFLHDRNPIDSIKTRIKEPDSIRKKLRKLQLPLDINSIENINDIAGVRILCPFINDIYMLSDCLLRQDNVELFEKKDYIANPKPNGYRSLHLIIKIPIFFQNEKRLVKVEIQFRTIAMEFWANLEHRLRYKKNINEKMMVKLSDELNECAEICTMLDRKMQNIQNSLNSNKK